MPLVPTPKNCDPSVKKAIQILTRKLGSKSNPTFTNLTLSQTCNLAAGLNVLRVTGLQTDDTALTGTLRGAYIDVSNGSTEATGTIRAMELKARTEAPGDTGSKVAVLEGLSISADSKAHDVTTMRAAEFILDGKTAGTIDEAVGLRIANNLQVDKATLSYGLQIYRDSFDYTYDISLSLGGHITGDSYVNQDIRTTASPTLAGLTLTGLTDNSLIYPSSNVLTSLGVASDGQLPIGSTGTTPVLATLTGSTDRISVTNGAGSITLDLAANTQTLLDSFNGIFLETIDFTISESGGTVTGSLEQDGTGDLIQRFSDGYSTLDCSPAKTIDLTAYVGTDVVPKEVFVYILQSAKTTLVASNSDWPATEHIKIANLVLRSAATTGTDGGALVNRNWNDHAQSADSQGHITHIEQRIRQEPTQWDSGVALTLKDSAGNALTTGNSSTAVELVTSAGTSYQLHKHTFTAIDMYTTATDKAHIVNQPTNEDGAYVTTVALVTDVTHYVDGTAAGVAIGVNKYFNLVIWGVQNRTGEISHLMINLPIGQYTNEAAAIVDASGYSVFDLPAAFKGVGFLIARLTFRLIAGAQWTYMAQEDLRGQIPPSTAGVSITTTAHDLLANLDFASAGHTGFQAQGDVLDDLNVTGANTFTGDPVNDFLVGTAAGTLVWQYGATARTSMGVGTGDSPQFTGIELGHANDTTITRVSAGVIAVEGVTVMLVGGSPTAHVHDGDTLQLDAINSSAGSFAFDTGGLVTFNEAITMSAGKDLTIAGHIIFNTNNSYIGFTNPKITFNDTSDQIEITGGLTGTSTAAFAGASVTIGTASTTTGTLILHDSGSANTITLTVPNALAASLTFTLPPTDGDNTNVLQTNGSGVLTWAVAEGTSHADVVVDGDFASNGILNRTGAGTYSILALGTDVQAYHANLAAIVAGTWTGAASITTLGTIATVGNITIADGGTIGQAAGPLLTFDDTLDYLEITGCKVGIGLIAPNTPLEILETSAGADVALLTLTNLSLDAGTAATLRFAPSSNSALRYAAISGIEVGGNIVHLSFITGSGATITEKMRIAITDIKCELPLKIKEQAAADGDTAVYGQIWVRSDDPNILMFTNGDGNDFTINVTAA